jgi:hypothetical protein
MENVIVGLIIALAAVYTVWRFVRKPSCGCGCDCHGGKNAKSSSCSCAEGQGGHSSCCCQK